MRDSNTLNLIAEGFSMFPYILHGERISLSRKKEIKIGAVVAFMKGEDVVLHRIVEITKQKVITKGDFNVHFDRPIEKNKIIGVAHFTGIRNLRILNALLTNISFAIGKIFKH